MRAWRGTEGCCDVLASKAACMGACESTTEDLAEDLAKCEQACMTDTIIAIGQAPPVANTTFGAEFTLKFYSWLDWGAANKGAAVLEAGADREELLRVFWNITKSSANVDATDGELVKDEVAKHLVKRHMEACSRVHHNDNKTGARIVPIALSLQTQNKRPLFGHFKLHQNKQYCNVRPGACSW